MCQSLFKSDAKKASISQSKLKVTGHALNKIQCEQNVNIPAHQAGFVEIGNLQKTALVGWVHKELATQGVTHSHVLSSITALRSVFQSGSWWKWITI